MQLILKADLASLHGLETVHRIDTDKLSFGSPVESTSFTLSVGAGPMPAAAGVGGGNAMFILARAEFPRVQAKVDIPLHNDEERAVNAVRFDVRLYLTVRGNGLGFLPVVDSNLLDAFDFTIHVPNPADTDFVTTANLKDTLKAEIEANAGKVASLGPFLTPWLTGGRFQLVEEPATHRVPMVDDRAVDLEHDQQLVVRMGRAAAGVVPGQRQHPVPTSGHRRQRYRGALNER